MRVALLLTVVFGFLVSCNPKSEHVFPGEEWASSTPEKQGVDSQKLAEALDYLAENSNRDKNSEVMIIRNGFVIYQGENADSVHNIWSCSKTFTSTVFGLLVDDGILSLDSKAAQIEPVLKEKYPEVTFRNFATMTSGYSAAGRSRWNDENEDWSWTPYVPDTPFFQPGTAYAYWDEAQMMFGRVMTKVLQKPMIDFLKERITDKIGMGDWKWYAEGDIDGITINNGCTNVHVSAGQLARWGLLFLNEGNWNGEQLISRDWVRKATAVQVPADLPTGNTDRKNIVGSGCYGFNWWVNGRLANGELVWPGAPEGTFWASGLNNNKCIVVPQWNMVIVRMGQDGHPPNADLVYSNFMQKIQQSIIQ